MTSAKAVSGTRYAFIISGDSTQPSEFLVRVRHDGVVEFGKNYTPDAATRIFWEAMASLPWQRCAVCNAKLGDPTVIMADEPDGSEGGDIN